MRPHSFSVGSDYAPHLPWCSFLGWAGYANRSTADTTAHRSDAVDQTVITPTPTVAPTGTPAPARSYTAPPPMTIDPNKTYKATVKTNKGDFTMDLYAKDAPQT